MSGPVEKLVRPSLRVTASTLEDLAKLAAVSADVLERILLDVPRQYGLFEIPKSDGGMRTIEPPSEILRNIQRNLLKLIYKAFRFPPSMHGCIPNRSIFTYARHHVGHSWVASLDLKSFFSSTGAERVQPVWTALGFRGQALELVTELSTLRNALPQGAPTSPALANLSFFPTDNQILQMCRRHQIGYGRYVDDLAFSSQKDFRALRHWFDEIIGAAGYSVRVKNKASMNPSSWMMHRSGRQVLCGLVINEKLRPLNSFVRGVRAAIRNCFRLGADAVAAEWGLTVQRLRMQLSGHVGHIRQTDNVIGNQLMRMLGRIKWDLSQFSPE